METVNVKDLQDTLDMLGINADVVDDGYNEEHLRITNGHDQLVIFATRVNEHEITLPVESAVFNNTATLAGALAEHNRMSDFESASDSFSFLTGIMRSML